MSNLSRLEAVSDALDTAINTANSLPEAGSGGVKTYTLKVESDGETKLFALEYVAYENNEYKFYFKSDFDNLQYPIYVENVVLNTPIDVHVKGGVAPATDLISNIEYAPYTSTIDPDLTGTLYDTGFLLPLEADADGYVVIRCYNDD